MLDLKEKILHHPLRQLDSLVLHEPANDEVAVPTIHLVESSAGNHVLVVQVQQARRFEIAGVHLAKLMDYVLQVLQLHVAPFLHFLDVRWRVEIRGKVQHGSRRQFWIDNHLAIGQRARQRVPPGSYVAANLPQPRFFRSRLLSKAGGSENGAESERSKCGLSAPKEGAVGPRRCPQTWVFHGAQEHILLPHEGQYLFYQEHDTGVCGSGCEGGFWFSSRLAFRRLRHLSGCPFR